MTSLTAGWAPDDYLSSARLRRMVLDFIQMHDFMQQPLVFERGEGIWVWDVRGERYLDGISGVWVVALGHGNRRVAEAITQQLERLEFCSPILSTNARAVEYVEQLGTVMPEGLTTIKLLSGGSEATETAIKLVRQYFHQTGHPHKKTVISRYLNFHGVTMGALAATGMASRKTPFEPLTGGVRHVAPPNCLHCPYRLRYPDCNIACARFLESVIQYEGPDTVAAFIAEPIQLSTGNVVPPEEYWPIIREICDRYGVMIILDEIATGFGRTGSWWGCETFGFVPDVLCAGKGLSAGYFPMSAVAFRDEVADAFISEDHARSFADGHTYGGNPLACAAAIAVLAEIQERGLVEQCAARGRYLAERLETLRDLGVIGDIRGRGLMIGIEFARDPSTMEPFPAEVGFGTRVGRNSVHRQQMLIRYAPHWVAVAPPYTVTEEEIDEMVGRLRRSIVETLGELAH